MAAKTFCISLLSLSLSLPLDRSCFLVSARANVTQLHPINWVYWNWLFGNRICLLSSSIFAACASSKCCCYFHWNQQKVSIEKSLVAHNFDKRQTPSDFNFIRCEFHNVDGKVNCSVETIETVGPSRGYFCNCILLALYADQKRYRIWKRKEEEKCQSMRWRQFAAEPNRNQNKTKNEAKNFATPLSNSKSPFPTSAAFFALAFTAAWGVNDYKRSY